LSEAVIFDGRNLYDPDTLKAKGLSYYAIGRSNVMTNVTQPYDRRNTDEVSPADSD
jgi:hypothetical protein